MLVLLTNVLEVKHPVAWVCAGTVCAGTAC